MEEVPAGRNAIVTVGEEATVTRATMMAMTDDTARAAVKVIDDKKEDVATKIRKALANRAFLVTMTIARGFKARDAGGMKTKEASANKVVPNSMMTARDFKMRDRRDMKAGNVPSTVATTKASTIPVQVIATVALVGTTMDIRIDSVVREAVREEDTVAVGVLITTKQSATRKGTVETKTMRQCILQPCNTSGAINTNIRTRTSTSNSLLVHTRRCTEGVPEAVISRMMETLSAPLQR